MNHNNSEPGRRIASLRKEKGLTQEKVGDLLHVTPQAISKWEQGNALPDTLLLPSLARLLGVSIDYLLTGESLAGKTGPYDGEYCKEGFYWGIQPSELAEQIVAILRNDTKNKRLLDLGSGEGRDAIYFAKAGFQVDALEISAPGAAKIKNFSSLSGYAVNVVHADMIGYELPAEYEVIYSCGSLQFLPLEERRRHFARYKQQTKPGGLNAHLAFVEKPFIKPAPDWERNEFFYQSGDLAGFYHDWEILQCEEKVVDCNSAGVPHRHALNCIVARKIN